MGQRQTDSSSVVFDNVAVYEDEILEVRDRSKFVILKLCVLRRDCYDYYHL